MKRLSAALLLTGFARHLDGVQGGAGLWPAAERSFLDADVSASLSAGETGSRRGRDDHAHRLIPQIGIGR